MKAIVKNTRQLISVLRLDSIWESNNGCKYHERELEFLEEKDIDWEERRYEIAKQMLTVTSNFTELTCNGITQRRICCEDAVQYAIKYADALIAELKKGGEK